MSWLFAETNRNGVLLIFEGALNSEGWKVPDSQSDIYISELYHAIVSVWFCLTALLSVPHLQGIIVLAMDASTQVPS